MLFLQFSQRRCLFVNSCHCGRNFLRTLCFADRPSGLWSSSDSLVVWRGRVQTAADKKVPGWRRVHSHFSATPTSETKTSDSAGRWSALVHCGTKELPIVHKKQLTLGCKGLDTDDMYCYKQAVILSLLFMPYVSCSFALKCHWIDFNSFCRSFSRDFSTRSHFCSLDLN